jgi:hypothetical protein
MNPPNWLAEGKMAQPLWKLSGVPQSLHIGLSYILAVPLQGTYIPEITMVGQAKHASMIFLFSSMTFSKCYIFFQIVFLIVFFI